MAVQAVVVLVQQALINLLLATDLARPARRGIRRPAARRREPRRKRSAVSAQQGMVVQVRTARAAAQLAQQVRTTKWPQATALVGHATQTPARAHARRRLQASVPQAIPALTMAQHALLV